MTRPRLVPPLRDILPVISFLGFSLAVLGLFGVVR